jgi:ZIP family zinc transporter
LCLVLYRLMPPHTHEDSAGNEGISDSQYPIPNAQYPLPGRRNLLAVGSLSIHSLMDGLGIGLALKVSMAVGIVAAIGVLVHDFSDGINTVAIVLRNGGTTPQARRWLMVDSCAPLLGVVCAYFITLSPRVLGLLLALFCGLFCYIGACDLLPEGYRRHTCVGTSLLALLGAGTVLLAVTLARV